MIACIGLVARVTQNKKSIRKSEISLEIRNQLGNQKSTWKSEINLEIRNQSLEIRNQVRNHGDLKSRMLFSKVSYPSIAHKTIGNEILHACNCMRRQYSLVHRVYTINIKFH